MEALRSNFNFKLPEGVSEDVNFEIMKKFVEGKKKFLETGFNTGYSAAFFLENGAEKVVSFDLCQYGYEQKAHDILEEHFPGKHELVVGDSMKTVPDYPDEKFDVIFVDGYHWGEHPTADIRNCARFAHEDTILIVDNISFHLSQETLNKYNWPSHKYYCVSDAWNKAITDGLLIPDRIECPYKTLEGGKMDDFPTCMGIAKYRVS